MYEAKILNVSKTYLSYILYFNRRWYDISPGRVDGRVRIIWFFYLTWKVDTVCKEINNSASRVSYATEVYYIFL